MKIKAQHINSIKKEIRLFEGLLKIARKSPRPITTLGDSEIASKIKVLQSYVKYMETRKT